MGLLVALFLLRRRSVDRDDRRTADLVEHDVRGIVAHAPFVGHEVLVGHEESPQSRYRLVVVLVVGDVPGPVGRPHSESVQHFHVFHSDALIVAEQYEMFILLSKNNFYKVAQDERYDAIFKIMSIN